MAAYRCAAFQFTRKGVITVDGTGGFAFEVLDAGAEDAVREDGEISYTDLKGPGEQVPRLGRWRGESEGC